MPANLAIRQSSRVRPYDIHDGRRLLMEGDCCACGPKARRGSLIAMEAPRAGQFEPCASFRLKLQLQLSWFAFAVAD